MENISRELFVDLYEEHGPHIFRVAVANANHGFTYFKVDESTYKVDELYKVGLIHTGECYVESLVFYLSDLILHIARGLAWLAKETPDGIEPLYMVVEGTNE